MGKSDRPYDRNNLLVIIQSCERILSYTEGMDRKDFNRSSSVVDACAFECLIAGAGILRLSDGFKKNYDGLPWGVLEKLGQWIAHAYGTDDFDIEVLWSFVADDVPQIRRYLSEVLKDFDSRGGTKASPKKKRQSGRK